jgi:hypothetical protein
MFSFTVASITTDRSVNCVSSLRPATGQPHPDTILRLLQPGTFDPQWLADPWFRIKSVIHQPRAICNAHETRPCLDTQTSPHAANRLSGFLWPPEESVYTPFTEPCFVHSENKIYQMCRFLPTLRWRCAEKWISSLHTILNQRWPCTRWWT